MGVSPSYTSFIGLDGNDVDKSLFITWAAALEALLSNITRSTTETRFSGVASFAAGAVGAPSVTATGDLDTGLWFPAANTVAGSVGGTEFMRVNATGLGIWCTPATKVHARLAADANLEFSSPSAGVARLEALNDARSSYQEFRVGGSPLILYAGSTPLVYVNSTGFGVGVAPATKVHLRAGTDANLEINSPGSGVVRYEALNDARSSYVEMRFSATPLSLWTSGVKRVEIDANGLLTVPGAFGVSAPVTKTADFSLAATENSIINNKSGSTCVCTLPAASTWTGRRVRFNNIQAQLVNSASSNVVPKAGGAAAASILPATAGAWCELESDSSSWKIMESGT